MTRSLPQAEDKTLPLVSYVLMLLAVVTGATAALALVIAMISRDEASERLRSHYDFVIQTFWVALFCVGMMFVLAGLFAIMGYAWLPSLGRLLYLLVSLWVVVRSMIGMLRLYQGAGMADIRTLGVPGRVEVVARAA